MSALATVEGKPGGIDKFRHRASRTDQQPLTHRKRPCCPTQAGARHSCAALGLHDDEQARQTDVGGPCQVDPRHPSLVQELVCSRGELGSDDEVGTIRPVKQLAHLPWPPDAEPLDFDEYRLDRGRESTSPVCNFLDAHVDSGT